MPGHSRNSVVHDASHRIAAIIGYMQQTGHPGMKKSRIADHCNRTRRISGPIADFLHAMTHADTGSHADTSIFRIERLIAPQ